MWIVNLFRTENRRQVAARDDTGLPPACVQSCNNAYSEAQSVGKTPSLCEAGSLFREYYNACNVCILTESDDPNAVTKSYLDPKFGQFLLYCEEQEFGPGIDPSWYASTTSWAVATFTNNNVRTTVTVLVDTSVIRSDWTGFRTPAPSSTSITASSSSRANSTTSTQIITTSSESSVPATTTAGANSASEQPTTAPPGQETNGPSPWVWAIIGAVIALILIGLGIVAFLFKKGKVRFLKKKLGLASAQELDGDANWRTGDKPELHGESSTVATSTGPPKELDPSTTVEPKELDSSVKPVEMPTDDPSTRPVELPTEFNDTRAPPSLLDTSTQDVRDIGLGIDGVDGC